MPQTAPLLIIRRLRILRIFRVLRLLTLLSEASELAGARPGALVKVALFSYISIYYTSFMMCFSDSCSAAQGSLQAPEWH